MKIYEIKARVWFAVTHEDGDDRPHDDLFEMHVGIRNGGLEDAIAKLDASMEGDPAIEYWELLCVSLVAEADL